jgi:hypothetical protein
LFAVEAIAPDLRVIQFLLENNAAAFPDQFLSVAQKAWKPNIRKMLEQHYDSEVLHHLDRQIHE